jgi:hypothetical protein
MKYRILLLTAILGAAWSTAAPIPDDFKDAIAKADRQSNLTAPGSAPFHLRLEAGDTRNEYSANVAQVELWWAAPDKWRREIKSQDFSQMAVQNGTHYSETNSGNYLPGWLNELATEALDPIPVAELKEAKLQLSSGCARWMSEFNNGTETATALSSICFNSDSTVKEVFARTAAATFADYRPFGTKLIARSMTIWHGQTEIKAAVTLLVPLQNDEDKFVVSRDTGIGSRLRFVTVPDEAASSFHEGDWRQSMVQLHGADAIRIARGYESPDGELEENAAACWFDPSGALQAQYSQSKTTDFRDFFEWGGKQLPRHVEMTENGALVLRILVDDIEPLATAPDSTFVIGGVTPQRASPWVPPSLCGVGSG